MKSIRLQTSKCNVCEKTENLKSCSRCKITLYCSRKCQTTDWKTHKTNCIKFTEKTVCKVNEEKPKSPDKVVVSQKSKDDAKKLFQEGKKLFSQKKIPEAIEKFKESIEINPTYGNSYLQLGLCFKLNGNKEKALNCFILALKLSEKHKYGNLYYLIGIMYKDLSRYLDGIIVFTGFIEKYEQFPNTKLGKGYTPIIYFKRSECFFHLRKYEKSLFDLKKSVFFSKKIDISIQIHPIYNVDVHGMYGNIYCGMRNFSKGIVELNKVFKLQKKMKNKPPPKKQAVFYFNRAKCYNQLDDVESALQDLNRAISLNKNIDAIAYVERGIIFKNKKKSKKALRDFGKALELDPKMDVFVYKNRGNCYFQNGDYAKARKDYLRFVEKGPVFNGEYNTDIFSSIAFTYCFERNFAKASEFLKKALHFDHKNKEMIQNLYELVEKLSNYGKDDEELERLFDIALSTVEEKMMYI